MMDLTSSFQQLGIALGLGLLVGLQRERAASRLAGMRTFPLVTVLGTLCSMLSQGFGGWILGAGFVALAAFAILGNLVELRQGDRPHLRLRDEARLRPRLGEHVVRVAEAA